LVRTKKLRKVKIQLSPESGNARSPLPDSREHVWPDPAKIAEFWLDSSGSGQILQDSNHFGQIRGQIHPNPTILAISGRLLTMAGFRPVSTENLVSRHLAMVDGCR
jgi:hypothetical protein